MTTQMPSQADLAKTPGMLPPGDQIPDFDAPYNSLQMGTVISFAVTYFFVTVFLGLRYFQSFKLIQKIEIDLVIITISYGVAMTYFITMVHLMDYGWGKHLWDGLLANTLSYLITPSVTKIAILAILFRINPLIPYRCAVVAIAVAIFTYTLVLCIVAGGPCNPLKEGTLQCLQNVALSHAVLNIASDFAVVAVPIPTIHGLNLSFKQKLSVGSILAAGSFVVICSIARLPYVLVLSKTQDATYTQAILGIWSIVEINLGIICACAMRLKRLVTTYLPSFAVFFSRSRGGSQSWKSGALRIDNSDGTRSHQLHSMKRANTGEGGNGGVQVFKTYEIDVERSRGSNKSTEQIIP
ncbi:hypothetical protein NCS57_00942800 [Fusarium keratoplasticum]|uniref:Uncharacterized protein n=1 Tax=Fusarium keratoplasticum TaxID=1328300 RepID=A0ACC0QQG9_9HYPO|nr:hypothetical protein NCS57_00942800 [Fusarium keratoplasticum]KAI8663420.1 hypothetical protein NCS57_00942800 [Fusarium keratoplasticum]